MKLRNSSPYKNTDLKDFIYACAKELRGGRRLCKDLTVIVKGKHVPQWAKDHAEREGRKPTRKYVGGRAYYRKVYHNDGYGYKMKLMIPADQLDKMELAYVVIHELAHCQGETHAQMRRRRKPYYWHWKFKGEKHDYLTPKPFQFARSLPLGLKEPPARKKRNVRLERYLKALQRVEYYRTKKKRTDNLLKKWQNKVKYYENDSKLKEVNS